MAKKKLEIQEQGRRRKGRKKEKGGKRGGREEGREKARPLVILEESAGYL